jgi:hypothetical protein
MSRIQFDDVVLNIRSATQQEWEESQSILAISEPGYATDTHILKFGNGKDLWKDLPALNSEKNAEILQEIEKRYLKPDTGIPAADLSEEIRTALTNTWEG